MNTIIYSMGLILAILAPHVHAADAWQPITKKTQPVLPGDEIQLLKLGPEKGQVLVGTLTGAATIENGVLRPMKQAKDLKVWDITKRPGGGLLIGHGEGALLVDGERTVPMLKGLNVPLIQMVGTQMWAIAKNESTDRNTLMQAVGDDWVAEPLFKGLNVLDLTQDSKGIFWLIINGDGVAEIDPAKGAAASRRHLSRTNITGILTDSQGRTWCGMMAGGVMVRQGPGQEWKRQLDRETTAVLSLLEAGDGKIWAATSGNGVWVTDGKDWKAMLQDEQGVNLMKMTSDKRIWVSTSGRGGLQYWNGTEWKVSLEGGMALRGLVELPKGVLMAGSVLDGLYVLGDYSIKGE
jgi:ligand-binding sensor domain-containing protein